jgi:aspartyl aminopeptidase
MKDSRELRKELIKFVEFIQENEHTPNWVAEIDVDLYINSLDKLSERQPVNKHKDKEKVYYCTFCGTNVVDALNGFDTCDSCMASM